MTDWLFDRHGRPQLIVDEGKIRSSDGIVVGWLRELSAYARSGKHVGWYENGVLFDRDNRVLGFLRNATGYLPSRPGVAGPPATPGFAGTPGRPDFAEPPVRPGFGGWSESDLEDYFE